MNEMWPYFLQLLIMLIAVHLLLDFAAQGDFMARAKNHKAPFPAVPWLTVLASHAFLHAAGVLLLTGSIWLFCCEFIAHGVIDWGKNEGMLSFNADQALHIGCKFLYVASLAVWV